MKKFVSLFLLFSTLLCLPGCGEKATVNEKTPKDEIVVTETFTLGNIQFPNLENYTVKNLSDEEFGNTFLIYSDNYDFTINLLAIDVSGRDQSHCESLLPELIEVIKEDSCTYIEKDPLNVSIGGFSLQLSTYLEINPDSSVNILLATSFTDSWYAYTIYVRQASSAGENTYASDFVDFLTESEYVGQAQRFDFIQ